MIIYGSEVKCIFIFSDPEDDYVAISSDEELVEALGNMRDDVFRVYIRGKRPYPSVQECKCAHLIWSPKWSPLIN